MEEKRLHTVTGPPLSRSPVGNRLTTGLLSAAVAMRLLMQKVVALGPL